MSIEAIAWAYTVNATPQERNVLFVLALHADKDWRCWPGLDTIVDEASMKRVPVIRALNKLEERGIIERTERGHRGQSTVYQLKGIQFSEKSILYGEKGIRKYTRILNIVKQSIVKEEELVYTSVYPITDNSVQNDTQSDSEPPVGEYGIWLDTFYELTKIAETHYSQNKASDAIAKMISAGCTVDDMRAAYDEVKFNYTIVSPASMLTPTLNAMRKRTTGGNGHKAKKQIPEYTPPPPPDDWNEEEYLAFVRAENERRNASVPSTA